MEVNMSNSVFPPEIYEKILYFADGPTLLQAVKVCEQWKCIVQYLDKKYKIWKYACENNIPSKFLFAMINNCTFKDENEKWEMLCRNWASWKNINKSRCRLTKNKQTVPADITCARISGNTIIYGTSTGKIFMLQKKFNYTLIFKSNIFTYIRDIFLLKDPESTEMVPNFNHTHFLVVYQHIFKLLAFGAKVREIVRMPARGIHLSVYKNFVCYSSIEGVIQIVKINFNAMGRNALVPVTCCQLYDPDTVRSLFIYEYTVTLVTDSNIMKIYYENCSPVTRAVMIKPVSFSSYDVDRYWIFFNEVVFATANNILHFMYIDEEKEEKKFNCMKILGSLICSINLYGNILVIATMSGQLYFYYINDWLNFDLQKYYHKIYIKGESVSQIDFEEVKGFHRLLLSMSDHLVELTIDVT